MEETKNSNPSASITRINEDTFCVVNFMLPGAFAKRNSNANTKEEIKKMKMSPILDENKKGRFICPTYGAPGRKLQPGEPLPKHFYVGPKHYNPATYHTCALRRVYHSEALQALSSDEARPYGYTKKQWDTMGVYNRLSAQFKIDAEELFPGNPSVTFEFVN